MGDETKRKTLNIEEVAEALGISRKAPTTRLGAATFR